jgi:alpha-galactosidase
VTVTNEGLGVSVLQVVSCLVVGRIGPAGPAAPEDFDLFWVDNEWLCEGRSHQVALRSLLPDVGLTVHEGPPRGCFRLQSNGSWGSGEHLPMGGLFDRASGTAWLWQVEHCGGWHWQVGERRDGVYVLLSGPTDREHQWQLELAPGSSFTTVSVALVIGTGGLEGALAGLTAYRRLLRRPHADHARLPIVYSDYMNTLMGEPTADKLAPLIGAAASVGVEVFCIDAGWHAGTNGWWDEVGNWSPAPWRFPGGFAHVTQQIKAAGMVPGLFLEPEVVGVQTEVARTLPPDAFFHRAGVRVAENGRYHLDLRSAAATAFLDETVDRLVREYAIGYMKFDYNINVGAGTDLLGESPGTGLLGHNRAYFSWIDRLAQRYPSLTIENCASGAMRADYSLLSRTQLQSTSDQMDLMRIPPIAAATPLAMTPEQAGIWAYPQPEFSDDEIAFAVTGALLGRIVLSGHLNRMSEGQRALVREGLDVYKNIRGDLATGTPFWPLGFPGWCDPWLAVGTKVRDGCYLTVWRRAGAGARRLEVASMAGSDIEVSLLYPSHSTAMASWDRETGELEVRLARPGQACLYHLAKR